MNICVFAGTTEGRVLSEKLAGLCNLHICVATEYGKMLDRAKGASVHVGRMDTIQMQAFLRENIIELVVDATHPYAVEATENIRMACENTKTEYIRLERGIGERIVAEANEKIIYVENAEEAADYLKEKEGNVLLTTGVKELSSFSRLDKNRIYVRIIPSPESLEQCLQRVEAGHIIAALGPFSEETNIANIHSTGARYLVTKQSGAKGGFGEKISAGMKTGITCVVIGKPEERLEHTYTEEAVWELLSQRLGMKIENASTDAKSDARKFHKKQVVIVGCGSGTQAGLTMEALGEIQKADKLIGAKRILEEAMRLNNRADAYPYYEALAIVEAIDKPLSLNISLAEKEKAVGERIVVLMSGDTGFYSGTKKLLEVLAVRSDLEVKILPGISSLSLLSAKTGISWEDAYICSMHGRELDIEPIVAEHKKVFVLLDNRNTPASIAKRLTEACMGDVSLFAGSMLGTEQEKIVQKQAKEWSSVCTDMPLCAMFIIK